MINTTEAQIYGPKNSRYRCRAKAEDTPQTAKRYKKVTVRFQKVTVTFVCNAFIKKSMKGFNKSS